MRKATSWLIPLLALTALVWAQDQAGLGATAEIVSAADPTIVLGTAMFTEGADGGVTMTLDIGANDVIAGGQHAIHVHENGSCEAADSDDDGTPDPAGAAGGHYNPTGVGHGDDNGPHVGDSEAYNYEFAEDGSLAGDVQFPLASLSGENSFLKEGGTAVIIHDGTDDTTSDPSGAAGARIACGLIAGA